MTCSIFPRVLVLSLWSSLAFAQSAASVCGHVLMPDERVQCMQVIAGHTVEPGAAAVCDGALMGPEKTDCLRGALDKTYSPDELTACRNVLMGGDKARCMAAAGVLRRAEERPRRRDDDEDDRRSRRRRDDDEEDDRRSRRRDDDDDVRTIRFTNYSQTSFTRAYWRARANDRFREVRLPADVGANRYQDLSVPDLRSLQFCAETWDGYRLFWPTISRDSRGPDVSANENHFERGRCRDL